MRVQLHNNVMCVIVQKWWGRFRDVLEANEFFSQVVPGDEKDSIAICVVAVRSYVTLVSRCCALQERKVYLKRVEMTTLVELLKQLHTWFEKADVGIWIDTLLQEILALFFLCCTVVLADWCLCSLLIFQEPVMMELREWTASTTVTIRTDTSEPGIWCACCML